MGMVQASSFNVRPAARVPNRLVTARRARLNRIDSDASRQLNSESKVAPRNLSNDWALVQQAIAGNTEARESLFACHTARLYRTAFSVLRNKEDAEDALQEGLCKAYTSLPSFEGRSSLYSWLTRIVINAALMIRRKNNAHPEASLDDIQENQPERLRGGAVDPRPDPERICAIVEFNTLVEECVDILPRALRAAFRLRVVHGFSSAESCRMLGVPANTFKSQIFRARQRLAVILQQAS